MNRPVRSALFAASSLLAAVPAAAQCGAAFGPGAPVPGLDGYANTLALLGNPARVVLGGDYRVAGDVVTFSLASWEPATGAWASFGPGVNGKLNASQVAANGDLYVGGDFVGISGVAASNVARWNGAAWAPVGGGVDGQVFDMATAPNGDLLVAGNFSTAGGVAADGIARWDGAAWSAIGAGFTNTSGVFCVAAAPNGDVIVGGLVLNTGAAPSTYARWDGATWSNLGQVVGTASDLAVLPNGTIVAAGNFITGGTSGVQFWTGAAWAQLGNWTGRAYALQVAANGDLVASGDERTARWDGAAWTTLGGATGARDVLELPNGDLIASGTSLRLDGSSAGGAVRWDGATWSLLDEGTNDNVDDLIQRADGSVVATGRFTVIEGVQASRIASWDGATWSPLGGGLDGDVEAVVETANGDLVVAGNFETVAGVPANGVARWDGAGWTPMDAGLTLFNRDLSALAVDRAGELFAGARPIAGLAAPLLRWNGAMWTTFAALNGNIEVVIPNPDAGITIGGYFQLPNSTAFTGIARWDGNTWTPLADGGPIINDLAYLPNGDLVVGGAFPAINGVTADNVARFDGASWQALGGGLSYTAQSLGVLPGGDLVVGGDFAFAGGQPADRIARWDGASWSTFGAGMRYGPVTSILTRTDGDVMLGGGFVIADGQVSSRLARLLSTCPATATPLGAGCTAPNNLTLTASELPWLGGTAGATATGLPTTSLAIGAFGLGTTALPLSSLLPQGVPGCVLFAAPDVLQLVVPDQGVATTTLQMPSATPLVGASFHHQLVVLDFGTIGALTTVTASDALTFTLGNF